VYIAQKVEETKKSSEIATEAGDWFTRVRALYIYPIDSSGSLSTIPGTGVGVNPAWTGEFDFGYIFTKNLGSELILGISKNTLRGTKIGTTWLLPPILTLQWRFCPSYRLQSYVGAGVNYTLFYGESCFLSGTSLSLRHSWGPVLQFGWDVFIDKKLVCEY
jgi:outer membrane protein